MKTKNKYEVPVRKEDIQKVMLDSPAHTGKLKYAIDYLCEENTPLLAAQDGEVVWVKQDSNVGGFDKKYWNDGNRVVIKHKNGEYSAYEHLKYNSAKVKVGDKVKKGQIIGYSGNTGYTKGPHLHFEVFKFTGPNKDEDFETLEINFNKEKKGKKIIKHIHLFAGILFLLASFIAFPISLTGFVTINEPTKLYLLQGVLFLIAVFEIYLSLRLK